MAKEGGEQAEETEQMIEKEPAEGGGCSGRARAEDAKEMRAVVLCAFGGLNKLRVAKKAMPEPQEGELKIRVKAWSTSLSPLGRSREKQEDACRLPASQWWREGSLLQKLEDSSEPAELGEGHSFHQMSKK
uniref:Uncharacterized protein n=1 Tax=Sphaerodactylus townsendi TaxID=933632 RepID=A0ACB8E9S0_9SAUR